MTNESAELIVARAQLATMRQLLASAKSLVVSEVALRRAKALEKEIAKLDPAPEPEIHTLELTEA